MSEPLTPAREWNPPDKCKGCGTSKDKGVFRSKYGEYCLDCVNCGVPDRDAELAAAREVVRPFADHWHGNTDGTGLSWHYFEKAAAWLARQEQK